jgi:hypothetical protein
MAKKDQANGNGFYAINCVGEGVSTLRAPKPADVGALVENPPKNVDALKFEILKSKVELLTQAGKIDEADQAVENYLNLKRGYSFPLMGFQRDKQNGNHIFFGAHWIVGAIRDMAKWTHPEAFYQKGVVGGTKAPSRTHFRKFVIVEPAHIFPKRPDGSFIKEPDQIGNQQPSPDVMGFSRYEELDPPYQFEFTVLVNVNGPFNGILKDPESFLKILKLAKFNRLGGSRGANYGHWKFVSAEIDTDVTPW